MWERPLKKESKHKTEQILKELNEAAMTINKDKCELNCDKVSYLQCQISKDGISPDERLTEKIAVLTKKQKRIGILFGTYKFL